MQEAMTPVQREEYTGPVAKPTSKMPEHSMPTNPITASNGGPDSDFHNRPATSGGSRNLQDSSFTLSGKFSF